MTEEYKPLTKEDILLITEKYYQLDDGIRKFSAIELIKLKSALQGLLYTGWCGTCDKKVKKSCLKNHIVKYLLGDIYYYLGVVLEK